MDGKAIFMLNDPSQLLKAAAPGAGGGKGARGGGRRGSPSGEGA
jgi:hypothetical protein